MNNTIIKHLNRIPMERHMSDWQIGDLAVCVDADGAPMLSDGAVYTVTRAFHDVRRDACGRLSTFTLLLREALPSRGASGFAAERFRKIRPDEHEACEPEFATLLKRAKRPVSA